MYHILDVPKDKSFLDDWISVTGDFDTIKGYTDLGDVFVVNTKTQEIGLLLTMENSFEPMGYTDWNKFEASVLDNPNFQEDVLGKSFLEKVKDFCGDLDEEQVYVSAPYPFIGGSGAPNTHKKGNVWVYLAISSQTWAQIEN